jgi:hypothetical protein
MNRRTGDRVSVNKHAARQADSLAMVSAETYLRGGVRSHEAHLITNCLGGRKGIRRTESVGTFRDRSPQDLAMEESQDGSYSEGTGPLTPT